MTKDFLKIADWTDQDIRETLELASQFKAGAEPPQVMAGKSAALIFYTPSLRTRISFEIGISQMGGHSMFITDAEISLGVRETIADVARVLSRYVSLITIRTLNQDAIEELAAYASVPVINALTERYHPCQVMGDILTAKEHLGRIDNLSIAFMGDGNNTFHSWTNLAALIPLDLRLGTSAETMPDEEIVEFARSQGKSKITITHDPYEAVAGADVIYTDVWASMGYKELGDQRQKILSDFQVNADLVKRAKASAIVMHCLPAERGREITDEVMDGPHSVVFDEAENRLHVQKAIIVRLMQQQP